MKSKFIHAYMDTAKRFALLSSAKRLQVGSIIVKDNRIISIGYNGTVAGWDNACEGEDGNTLPTVIHAEMNAISKLTRSSETGDDSTMFLTHSPCINCSKAIYGAGIREVYYNIEYKDLSGVHFLEKCGIKVIDYKSII